MWKDLRFPSQTIIQSEISRDLPLVLDKQRILIIGDRRSARGIQGLRTRRRAMLQIEKQRATGEQRTRRASRIFLRIGVRLEESKIRPCAIRAFCRRWPEARSERFRRCIAQEACHAVKDVTPGEEAAEDLRIYAVQPFAAELPIVFAGDNREAIAQIGAPENFVYRRFQKKRLAESERRPELHRS